MKKTWARVIFVLVASVAFALGSWPPGNLAQAATPEKKEDICHFPPGNPQNVRHLSVGESAVPAHVKNHNDAVCPAGDSDCCFGGSSAASTCTSFASDVHNCGKCGNACPTLAACTGGACVCPAGTTACGGACVSTGTSTSNCGACGNVCPAAQTCTGGACVCPPGETLCGSACVSESTSTSNCGKCGNVCPTADLCVGGICTPPCPPGEALCSGMCTNEQTDVKNCGACGTVCPAADTCVGGSCVLTTVASSCLPTSSLSVLIQGTKVTAYVPLGSWSESTMGVHVTQVEPAPIGHVGTVGTVTAVNSCSSCSSSACGGGITVCTGNSNDVYVITPPITVSATPTAHATASQVFSGGACMTCGVAIDAATGIAWIAEGSSSSVGQLEPLTPPSTFGTPIGLFGQNTSEDVSVDPVRSLILSANEHTVFQIINTATGAVYNNTAVFPPVMDSTAEDCSTAVALAPVEATQKVVLANLSAVALTPGTPGTWSAPTNIQDFSPDFVALAAGASGSAVAPGSHLAIISGEFGGSAFGVLQLQPTVGPTTVPMALDWVAASVPAAPDGPWSMGLDPHGVTAYVSPNDGKAYALMTNFTRTYLVKVDMALLLSAPRLAGTHTADPALIPPGTFNFIPQ